MTYDLALRLKNAGFPQGEPLEEWMDAATKSFRSRNKICPSCHCWVDSRPNAIHHNQDCPPIIRYPTLSELIEACGVAFSELSKLTHTKQPQRWVAVSYSCEECGLINMEDSYASTPEEAVANLWLALNKK